MDQLACLILVALLAFSSELLSSIFGGGYGTILTPTLVLMGYELGSAVPSTLISQLVSSVLIVASYHRLGTITVSFRSKDMRVAAILASCGLIGVAIAVLALVSLPETVINAYVALVVLAIGLVVLAKRNTRPGRLSLGRLVAIGVLSAFNKGLSGGGYGPLVSGGQVASGTGAKSAVGRMLMAEVVVCSGAILAYVWLGVALDWALILAATVGASLMAPLSAYVVRRAAEKRLKLGMGIMMTSLGAALLVRSVLTWGA